MALSCDSLFRYSGGTALYDSRLKKDSGARSRLRAAGALCCFILLFASSCGYHLVGSRVLPFSSVAIRPVENATYEPGLEERMHRALSNEFINQGIEVKAAGGDVDLETRITTFALGAIGAVDETVKEQEIEMYVDFKVLNKGNVTELSAMQSPIKITFQTTGTVSQSVAFKERATDKACSEIARELISKIIMEHAQ